MSSLIYRYQKSLFLLFLSIFGRNFVTEIISCNSQKILEKNILVKSLILFFLIYFTMNFTDKSVVHPLVHLKRAVVVWLTLLMFTKMNNLFAGIIFSLLILSYIVNNYIEYYNQEHYKNKHYLNTLRNIDYILIRLTVLFFVTGFSIYLLKEIRNDKKFSFNKFVFGVKKCGPKT